MEKEAFEELRAELKGLKAEKEALKNKAKAERERLKAEFEAERERLTAEFEAQRIIREAEAEKLIDDAIKEVSEWEIKYNRLSAEKSCLELELEICMALHKAGAKNIEAARALIDRDAILAVGQADYVSLDDRIKALKENEDTSFLFESKKRSCGFVPHQPDFGYREKIGYKGYCELYP